MWEEELETAVEETTEETTAAEEAGEAEEEIEVKDINVALLEAMIKRTEVLEMLVQGKLGAEDAEKMLAEIAVPSLTRTRKRRRK